MRLAIALLFLALGLGLTVVAGREVAEFGRAGPAAVLIQAGILVLPIVALAALFRFRIEALGAASVAWPLLVLWAFPRWTPLPPEPPAPVEVVRVAPAPPPPAPAPKAAPPATTVSAGPPQPFHLAIHGAGMNPRVPVHLQGKQETIWLHLDTGASLTVISAQDLAKLGIALPAGSPEVTFHLANNAPDTNPVMLIDRLEVGGFEVEGVTVAVCTNCMELLGMNVLSQLHLSVDPEAGELLLSQLNGVPERLLDVTPWLALESQRVAGAVRVKARNSSGRRIDQARVEITCGGKSAEAVFDGVGPMDTAIADLPADAVGNCSRPGLRLTSALW